MEGRYQFRLSLNLSNEEIQRLKDEAWKAGKSVNGYMCDLIRAEINKPENIEKSIKQTKRYSQSQRNMERAEIIEQFISECLVETFGNRALLKNIYERYIQWCHDRYSALSVQTFANVLRGIGIYVIRGGNNKSYVWGYDVIEQIE